MFSSILDNVKTQCKYAWNYYILKENIIPEVGKDGEMIAKYELGAFVEQGQKPFGESGPESYAVSRTKAMIIKCPIINCLDLRQLRSEVYLDLEF